MKLKNIDEFLGKKSQFSPIFIASSKKKKNNEEVAAKIRGQSARETSKKEITKDESETRAT